MKISIDGFVNYLETKYGENVSVAFRVRLKTKTLKLKDLLH